MDKGSRWKEYKRIYPYRVMVEKTDWNKVLNRPLIDDIPESEKLKTASVFENANSCVEDNWGKVWIPNLESNLKTVKDFKPFGINQFAGCFEGETAFIIGGGPSLYHNIDDLPKGKGKIITSGHTLKFLLSKGIKPDFTVVVDGAKEQADWLDVGDESKDLNLLIDITSSPEILKVWKGKIFFFRTTALGETETSKKLWAMTDFSDMLYTGGNVITGCVYLANMLGFKRIVFAGSDLAMGAEEFKGMPYADKSHDVGKPNVYPGKFFYDFFVDVDIQGLGTQSLMRMWCYKQWIEIRSIEWKHIEFINCTEAGTLGAHYEGNLRSIKQVRLKDLEV